MTTRAAAIVAAAAISLAAVGCGDSGGREAASARQTSVEEAVSSTTVVPPPTASTLERPAALGERSRVGGYEITVTGYASDATSSVVEADPRNQPPVAGRYAAVELTLRNLAAEPVVASRDLALYLVGSDGASTRHWDCTAHLGERAVFNGLPLFPGGQVSGEVCFDLTPAAAGEATIVVAPADEPLEADGTRYWTP